MAAGDLILNAQHITGVGTGDLHGNDASPQAAPGTISMLVDAFGLRIFKYVRAISALAKSDVAIKVGDNQTGNTQIANVTSGNTTDVTKSGFTANNYRGAILYVYDDAGGAGAAPEGEATVVASNTTTKITFEPDLPLSAALAANDDIQIISTFHAEGGGASTLASEVHGVAVGNNGISAGQYGWVVQEGFALVNADLSTAIAINKEVIAGASAKIVVSAATTVAPIEQTIGVCLATVSTDSAVAKAPIYVKCFTPVAPNIIGS